jgi:hypothetical protein
MSNIGLITEQGDLGLGFEPLSHKDQELLKEQNENLVNRDNEDKNN